MTWPTADGTRIEVASEIKKVAAGVDIGALDITKLGQSFAFCKDQQQAAAKLVELSGNKVDVAKAAEIVSKAYEARVKRVRNNKSDADVSEGREK